MAIRFPFGNHYLSRTTGNFPGPGGVGGDWTITFWQQYNGGPLAGQFRTVHVFSAIGPQPNYTDPYTFIGSNGGESDIYLDSLTDVEVWGGCRRLTPNVWYPVALEYNDTAKTLELFVCGQSVVVLSRDYDGVDPFVAELFSNNEYPVINMASFAVADYRGWSALLTPAELVTEAASASAVRTADLLWDRPFPDPSDTTDHSLTEVDMTTIGTLETVPDPDRSVLPAMPPVCTPIVDPPTPSDDPCAIDCPLYFVAIQPSAGLGAVLQGGQTPLRDADGYLGGFKPALVRSISAITRAASDYLTGSLPAQTASVTWADTRRFVRGVFGSVRADFTSSPIWIYLYSYACHLAEGIPRLLFYGFIKDDPISENLTYTTNANDLVGKDYSLLGDEILIPQRVLSDDDLPGLLASAKGLGVPIIGGVLAYQSDNLYGALKPIDCGDYTCQDSVVRRFLLVAGHACKTITPFQNGPIPGGDYGVNIWAPGHASWTDIVPSNAKYLDINGNRYVPVLVTGWRAAVYDPDSAAVTIGTVASAASTTVFTLGAGEGANFAATDTIDVRRAANSGSSEVRIVSSVVGDVVTVNQALGDIPAAGDTISQTKVVDTSIAADLFLYVDVDGATPDDAEGNGTVEEDLILLDRWVHEQFIFSTYRSGAWLPSPTFEFYPGGGVLSNLLDRQSWDDASAVGVTYLAGGFKGAFVTGAHGRRQSVRQIEADLARSGNFSRGWRGNNQFFVRMLDRDRTRFLAGRATITDRIGILSRPRFAPTPLTEWLCNDLTSRYAANYRDDGHGDWGASINHGNAPSKISYGLKEKTETYPMVRDHDTADTVNQQRIDFLSTLPQLWVWGESLCGMKPAAGRDRGVLDGIAVTQYGGKSATGFEDNGMWILKQQHITKPPSLIYWAVDVDRLLT